MKKSQSILMALILILAVSSCRPIQITIGEHPASKKESPVATEESGRVYPFSALRVPPGHLPPPGQCRIWFPGRPPGHQPPPTSCATAMKNAPLGAWVITRDGGRYKVSVFSKARKNIVEEVRYYLKD